MASTDYKLTPPIVEANFQVLRNLQDDTKLRSDSEGRLSIEDRWGAVFRRKAGSFDIAVVEATFQSAINLIRNNTGEASLKTAVANITDQFDDAVKIGLVRQMRLYAREAKTECAQRYAKLILFAVDGYNKVSEDKIVLRSNIKSEIGLELLPVTQKIAVIPSAPPPPSKERKKKRTPQLTDTEKMIHTAVQNGLRTQVPFSLETSRIPLRMISAVVAARGQMPSFNEKLADKARERVDTAPRRRSKGKQPDPSPIPDTSLLDALARRRAVIDGKKDI